MRKISKLKRFSLHGAKYPHTAPLTHRILYMFSFCVELLLLGKFELVFFRIFKIYSNPVFKGARRQMTKCKKNTCLTTIPLSGALNAHMVGNSGSEKSGRKFYPKHRLLGMLGLVPKYNHCVCNSGSKM